MTFHTPVHRVRMRRFQCRTMIASLLFHVLYPLSRFLTFRSEASKKGLPPAQADGREVLDGGAVTTRKFNQSCTTLLDLWLSSSSEMEAEKKERLKEPMPEKECDTGLDIRKDQLTVLSEESKEEAFEVMWRVWEEADESASAAGPTPKFLPYKKTTMDFTVMSYNILAQDLLEANQELYIHCPLEVLDWSYRCRVLLEEILKWAPDILCLQEVQENHYHEQLYPALSQMGFTCVYKRRTGNKTDGCATCYRSSRFSELSVALLEFFRPETELLDRHNVGIVLLLQPVVTKGSEIKAKGQPLCVANTHLLFNPRRGDVKLAQLAILLAEIDSVVKSCKVKDEQCNIILCGDFNSLPYRPLYQLITTGELYFQGLPAWTISGQEDHSYKVHYHKLEAPLWPSSLEITDSCQYSNVKKIFKDQEPGKHQYSHDFLLQLRFCPAARVRPPDLELIPGVTDNTPDVSRRLPYIKRFRHTLSHHLDLESVYKHMLPGSGNPEVTTLHSEGAATVDYIFYTPRRVTSDQTAGGETAAEGLVLKGSLTLPSEDVLWSMMGLPNHMFPSDHLSLIAKFQLELDSA